MRKKSFIGIVGILLAVIMTFCSCKPIKTDEIIDDSMTHFLEGKTEVFPSVRPVDSDLDELILKYSGGFEPIEIVPAPVPDPIPAPPPVEDTSEIQNIDDLIQIFDEIISSLDESENVYTLKNGFMPTVTDYQLAFAVAERDVPLYANYAASVTFYDYTSGTETYLSLQMDYRLAVTEIQRQVNEAKKKAKEIENKLNLISMSDYDKVFTVNKYLCDNAYYQPIQPYQPVDHSAYGALIEGVCVCDGYARSCWLLLSDVGMEIYVITGNVTGPNGGPHAWNVVNVDGNWYQLDICWNDGGSTDDYLLVDDNKMRQEREWEYNYFPPCISGKYKKP